MSNSAALASSIILGLVIAVIALQIFNKRKIFTSRKARVWAGAALGVLSISMFPVLAEGPIENNEGEIINPYSYTIFSLIAFLFWMFWAFMIDRKEKNKNNKKK